MTTAASFLNLCHFSLEVQSLDDLNSVGAPGYALGFQLLPTDPIGYFQLTLTNVVVGSSILIESQDETTIFYNGTTATSSPQITLSVYASGSNLNDLRIRVRKGSSPSYKPYETLATAVVGGQSIYVSQIPDE